MNELVDNDGMVSISKQKILAMASMGTGQKEKEKKVSKKFIAHREGRTRSLQIPPLVTHCKSLTLYPIELGGHIESSIFTYLR
jgi:hypothetical protein